MVLAQRLVGLEPGAGWPRLRGMKRPGQGEAIEVVEIIEGSRLPISAFGSNAVAGWAAAAAPPGVARRSATWTGCCPLLSRWVRICAGPKSWSMAENELAAEQRLWFLPCSASSSICSKVDEILSWTSGPEKGCRGSSLGSSQ